jgi:hypothetical protein
VEIVIDYEPRTLQRVIHDQLENHLRGVAVCHRRFGKTVLAVNHLQKAALTCRKPRPRFAYIAPTFTQGKSIAWDYMKYYASPIPGHSVHESELRVDYPNGGQVRIYGADNPDRLRGLYFDGVVLDEYGLMPPRIFTEVVSPTLVDRQGWAFFIGTPNGKNQFYDVAQKAKDDAEWFFSEHKASQTGIIPADHLRRERELMTPDEYAQEFECSFEASVKGAIYARELLAAREQGRLTRVPYDPAVLVDTDWDLGFGDLTAIWFSQSYRSGEVRLIDYYEASGMGLPHFLSVMKQKGYSYGAHWAPHDIQLLEMSGHSRLEAAHSLGLHFMISPKVEHIEDGIHAARMLLPRCYFDVDKCKDGLEALHNYRWKVPNVQDPTGRPLPVHDWASHGSDAFRGLAYRHYVTRRSAEKEQAASLRRAQRDTGETFRWQQPRAGRGGY